MADIVIKNGLFLFWQSWPSNWTISPFVVDGIRYDCVEQYMMAQKAAFFGDEDTRQKIMLATHPGTQKSLGRQVKFYQDDQWAEVRYTVVLRATLEKYRQNSDLQKKLLDTGDLIMVEASPEDNIWGIGLAATHDEAADPKTWKGQNLLGKALNNARSIIRYKLQG